MTADDTVSEIIALMGMAAFASDEEIICGQFRRLRLAAEQFKAIDHPRIEMLELSMLRWPLLKGRRW